MAQILGQKSPFGGLCNCVRQKWGHANLLLVECKNISNRVVLNNTIYVAHTDYKTNDMYLPCHNSFQTLPKTSYYKMIDWWLLVALNILVVTMLFHTFLASVVSKAKKKPMRLLSAKSVFNFKQHRAQVRPCPFIQILYKFYPDF